MADEMTQAESAERIWDAAGKLHTAMLVTRSGDALISRPMAAMVKSDEGLIYFLTDKTSGKLEDIAEHPGVSVSFSDGSDYIAFTGKATVHDDRALIKRLWSTGAQAYYPNGPDDPLVIALRVQPSHAELWDGPGTVVSMVKMAAAAATGTSARDMGDHVQASM